MVNFGSLSYELFAILPFSKKRIYMLKREVGLDILLCTQKTGLYFRLLGLGFLSRGGGTRKEMDNIFPQCPL